MATCTTEEFQMDVWNVVLLTCFNDFLPSASEIDQLMKISLYGEMETINSLYNTNTIEQFLISLLHLCVIHKAKTHDWFYNSM